jgi:hypothetical protein
MWAKGEAETRTSKGFERLRKEEDALLFEAGFELAGSSALMWVKDGVCFGREAALQTVRGRYTLGSEPSSPEI